MTGIRQRILQRYLPVALALAGMGYFFAETCLFLQRIYGGVADPANEQVRWRTPLTMVGFGLILMLSMEGLIALIRRKPSVARAPIVDDAAKPSRPGIGS